MTMGAVLQMSKRNAAIALGVLSLLYLVSTTYAALNGTHVWRQSDAFAQIMSFLGAKSMEPLQLFNQPATMFDTPIYEWLAATLSRITSSDPLVSARLVNDLFWCVFLLCGYRVTERIVSGAGLYFVFLAATSPVFLQYFAAPIPDGMALALSIAAIDVMATSVRALQLFSASLLFIVAALIKSPIPFVIIVFFVVSTAVTALSERGVRGLLRHWPMVIPLAAAMGATVAAEVIRKIVTHSTPAGEAANFTWYFGTGSTRLQQYYWQTMLDRATASFASPALVAVVLLGLVVLLACAPHDFARLVLPPAAGFFAGWLVFANVFLLHDYYEMAVSALLMIGSALALELLAQRARAAIAVRGLGLNLSTT
ncbi:hypothetical protein [uncultured Amnibacterium sp.]|uniref:hypothetical protein n=1 Tax=uncultured Amnibacterium sp. TaxID=1631851 RepID=UPI0035CBD58E